MRRQALEIAGFLILVLCLSAAVAAADDGPLEHVSTPYANADTGVVEDGSPNDSVVRFDLKNIAGEAVTVTGIRLDGVSNPQVKRLSVAEHRSQEEMEVLFSGTEMLGYISSSGLHEDSMLFEGVEPLNTSTTPEDWIYPFDEQASPVAWLRNSSIPRIGGGEVVTVRMGMFRPLEWGAFADMKETTLMVTLFYEQEDEQQFVMDIFAEGTTKPAAFDVGIRNVTEPVRSGEPVTVELAVANTGWEAGETNLVLNAGNETVVQQPVMLYGNDSTVNTLNFTWTATRDNMTNVTLNASAGADHDVITVRVAQPEPAGMRITGVPETVLAGEDVGPVTVNVTDATGTPVADVDVALRLNTTELLGNASTGDAGGAVFTPVINRSGTYTMIADVPGYNNVSVTSQQFTVTDEMRPHIRFVTPLQEETVAVGREVPVVVEVLDSGEPVIGANVSVNGQAIVEGGEHASEPRQYSGTIVVEPGTRRLVAQTVYGGERITATRRVQPVQTMELSLNVAPPTVDAGQDITVDGRVTADRPLVDPTVTVRLIDPNSRVQWKRTDANAAFTFRKRIAEAAQPGAWRVVVNATDAYETRERNAPVQVERPESNDGRFRLRITAPDAGSTVSRRAPVSLRVVPTSIRTERPIRLDVINCWIGDHQFAETWNNGAYHANMTTPATAATGTVDAECHGERVVDGERYTANASVPVHIAAATFNVTIINADELKPGGQNTIRVNVSGQGRTAENVTLRMTVDGKTVNATFTRAADGAYEASAYLPEGAREVAVTAASADNVYDQFRVGGEDSGGFSRVWIAVIVFVVLSALIAMQYTFQLEPPEERIEDLEQQKRSIEESMRETEWKYRQQQLDRQTYREIMEKYEQKWQLVRDQIKKLYKEQDSEEGRADNEKTGVAG